MPIHLPDHDQIRKKAELAGTIAEVFTGREGFHNALILAGVAVYGPVSSNELARKIDIDQTVTFRRLKDLTDRWLIGPMKELAKNGSYRNVFRLTWNGLRVCSFLDLGDDMLESAEICDPLNNIVESRESRIKKYTKSEDPIPLKFKLQVDFLELLVSDIYSVTAWGKEWLYTRNKLEHKLGKEKLTKWLFNYPSLEDATEIHEKFLEKRIQYQARLLSESAAAKRSGRSYST